MPAANRSLTAAMPKPERPARCDASAGPAQTGRSTGRPSSSSVGVSNTSNHSVWPQGSRRRSCAAR